METIFKEGSACASFVHCLYSVRTALRDIAGGAHILKPRRQGLSLLRLSNVVANKLIYLVTH